MNDWLISRSTMTELTTTRWTQYLMPNQRFVSAIVLVLCLGFADQARVESQDPWTQQV